MILVGIFVPKDATSDVAVSSKKIPFSQVISDRNVIVLFVAMLLLNFLLYGNMSWLPTILAQKFGLSIAQIFYLLAFNVVFQTIATMFAGILLSKLFLGKERIFYIKCYFFISWFSNRICFVDKFNFSQYDFC